MTEKGARANGEANLHHRGRHGQGAWDVKLQTQFHLHEHRPNRPGHIFAELASKKIPRCGPKGKPRTQVGDDGSPGQHRKKEPAYYSQQTNRNCCGRYLAESRSYPAALIDDRNDEKTDGCDGDSDSHRRGDPEPNGSAYGVRSQYERSHTHIFRRLIPSRPARPRHRAVPNRMYRSPNSRAGSRYSRMTLKPAAWHLPSIHVGLGRHPTPLTAWSVPRQPVGSFTQSTTAPAWSQPPFPATES